MYVDRDEHPCVIQIMVYYKKQNERVRKLKYVWPVENERNQIKKYLKPRALRSQLKTAELATGPNTKNIEHQSLIQWIFWLHKLGFSFIFSLQ